MGWHNEIAGQDITSFMCHDGVVVAWSSSELLVFRATSGRKVLRKRLLRPDSGCFVSISDFARKKNVLMVSYALNDCSGDFEDDMIVAFDLQSKARVWVLPDFYGLAYSHQLNTIYVWANSVVASVSVDTGARVWETNLDRTPLVHLGNKRTHG